MDKLIDLHTHTDRSDGELSPNELIKYAISKNIGVLAITDHDTINGIKTVDKSADFIIESEIKIINGIELSAKVDKGRMHILGYGIDLNNEELNKKTLELRSISINATMNIYEQIKKDYHIIFSDEDIDNLISANRNIGRPDLARLCIKYGYVNTVKEAFDRYLVDTFNKTRKVRKGIDIEECLNLIKNSGGIPVLAHPKTLELNDKELLILIRDMMQLGLQGIEVYHSSHSMSDMDKYLKIANAYNLLISGGSDYHGKNTKPDVEIGIGKNNLKIKKLSILDKLL